MDEASLKTRPRKAAGPDRPSYLVGADTDKVMMIVLALMSEVASLRDRVDAHERLGSEGKLPAFDMVEAFMPDDPAEAARSAWRQAFIRRLFRVVTEEIERAQEDGTIPAADGVSE